MKKQVPKSKRRPKPLVELEMMPSVEMVIKIETDGWRETALQSLGSAGGFFAVSCAALVFQSSSARAVAEASLAAAWFCGAFALASLLTVAMYRVRWFSRLDISMRDIPARFRPSFGVNAFFWLCIFMTGLFLHVKLFVQR